MSGTEKIYIHTPFPPKLCTIIHIYVHDEDDDDDKKRFFPPDSIRSENILLDFFEKVLFISLSGRRVFDSQSIRLSETVFFRENPLQVPT